MEASPLRILHIFGSLDRGGAEAMLMNLYRCIDRDRLQFDFVVNESEREYAHEEEIRELGGRVYHLPLLSLTSLKKHHSEWSRLLQEHPEWSVIHTHHTSIAALSLPVAKRHGRITIAHSHTAGSNGSLKARVKILTRLPLRYLADHLFSCSQPAAQWMFGSQAKRAHILNNAIDTLAFQPEYEIRHKIRKSLYVGDAIKVIGHVGRFVEEKNHIFMLEVLKELVKRDSEIILLLVGDGPLKPAIMQQAEDMGLMDHVKFTGVRSDIPDLMQGMDAFFFPSLYEGLPVTLVEAQASGLPCLVSDSVNSDVRLASCIEFMTLKSSPQAWAQRLLKMSDTAVRQDTQKEVALAGYDVKDNAKWLESFYFSLVEPV